MRFCGKKRLKNTLKLLGRDTCSGITDREFQPLLKWRLTLTAITMNGSGIRSLSNLWRSYTRCTRYSTSIGKQMTRYSKNSPIRHSLQSVHIDIEHHLFNLSVVNPERGNLSIDAMHNNIGLSALRLDEL